MMSKKLKSNRTNRGFTIVEFMIATVVFSLILLVVTAAILQIGKSYRRSMVVSNTQAAARNLVDSVAQAVQYSSADILIPSSVGGVNAVCAGNKQFLYVLNRQISDDTGNTKTDHAVMTRAHDNCGIDDIISSVPTFGSPKELLGKGMRLVKLDVAGGGRMYTVTARVVYGDDDLLCSPSISSGAGSCVVNAPEITESDLLTYNDLACRPGIGSEFCAFSELSTTVQKRL